MTLARKLKTLTGDLTSLTDDNCQPFAEKVAEICGLSVVRIHAMLHNLMPLHLDNMGLFRMALAVIEYLPLFEKDNLRIEGKYTGVPSLWVHCRMLSARPSLAARKPETQVVALALTSILAGRILVFRMNFDTTIGVLKRCGVHKHEKGVGLPLPQELTGTYHFIKFGTDDNALCMPVMFDWHSSESKANRELRMMRKLRNCPQPAHITCVDCCAGRDVCPAACRAVTKR